METKDTQDVSSTHIFIATPAQQPFNLQTELVMDQKIHHSISGST